MSLILGIETSCDETAAAVVQDGKKVLSNIISSQMEIHRAFGGVVPEVASRHHVQNITVVLEQALREAGVHPSQLSAVAVTQGPGLVGALLVGIAAAKALAFSWGLPLLAVNHMAGHIYANQLVAEMEFPLLALVVSGGHTELVWMPGHGEFVLLGQTRDDAAGEAYDKVARSLDLPYPGGPLMDRLAQQGQPRYDLPRAWLEEGSYDFSFSGLKTAVQQLRQKEGENLKLADLAASFQAAVVEVLVEKTARAAEEYGARQVLLAGGVAANRGLRSAMQERIGSMGLSLVIPPPHLCTDNAAMIAAYGHLLYTRGQFAAPDLNAVPGLSLS